MFDLRNMQSLVIASAMLCYFAAAGQGAAPDVTYIATGVFATPPVSGQDVLGFAGQPFTVTFVVNEATKPTRRSETMAEYSNVTVVLTIELSTGQTFQFTVLDASLFLVVGPPDKPDWIAVKFPFPIGTNDTLAITAKVGMPAGTIATPLIKPFTVPVTLNPSDGEMTYACPACSPPWTGNSSTLAIAGGTLIAIAQ